MRRPRGRPLAAMVRIDHRDTKEGTMKITIIAAIGGVGLL
jgi:hypothetical protein